MYYVLIVGSAVAFLAIVGLGLYLAQGDFVRLFGVIGIAFAYLLVAGIPVLAIADSIKDKETISTRYGLSEDDFPEGYPDAGEKFLLSRDSKAIECRTEDDDATVILCPKDPEGSEYTPLERRGR